MISLTPGRLSSPLVAVFLLLADEALEAVPDLLREKNEDMVAREKWWSSQRVQ